MNNVSSGQATHVWVCRTTTVSIFEHGILGNKHTTAGVCIAIALGCFVVYTPGIQVTPSTFLAYMT